MNRIIRIRMGWVIGLYYALSYGSVISLGSWVPTLLKEALQDSTGARFAWAGALVMMISGIGRLSGGVILYWFRPYLIANGTILALLLLYAGLFAAPSPGIVMALALMAAFAASINFGAFFDIASRTTNPESLGSFIGFINLLANLGAVLFTLIFGWFKDAYGMMTMGFGVMAVICLFALLWGRSSFRSAGG
ncbi:MAG: MFS transporter [Desulfobacterales bacterium]|nr:MFS transporter [Desulfobacterales bacterium]